METKQQPDTVQKTQDAPISARAVLVYGDSTGCGYDIYVNGAKYIHQPRIPAIETVKGFKTKEEAQKVADLVISKIYNHINPPCITVYELDSLGMSK